ncbi:peptidoglycan DD-metalloendopeptidase family protein [Acidisoma cellulosilytica]|uniref:Peptidoglycan DD-metalloendopeptidase family protein n=1 Tax=Acidisoma cellulosilyticum TaxID=2802395 RepID=A0A963YX93_9PROT|nr:peptidoglycan DD-metalloendopeptidase family protein [Acidisoma cellulosilyticum]MCB8878779.1 peptidoglycan DD-metalloendopeptidase family protein [Acidisoma cellulosilyticum]
MGAPVWAASAPSQADVKRAEGLRALHQSQAIAARAKAAALAAMQASLSQQRVQAAARLRAAEDATAAAADRMADLAAQKKKVTAELVARAAAFAPMLPLIERLALYPSETLLAVPAPPQNTLRGLLVLQGLSREIGRQAAALKAERDQLDKLTADMQAAAPALAQASAVQAAQEAALDAQIASAAASRQSAESAAAVADQAAARDATRAQSLQDAIKQIAAARAAAAAKAARLARQAARAGKAAAAARAQAQAEALATPAGNGLGKASGQIMSPVAGKLIRGWGDQTLAGPATGLSYATPPNARVVSPCTGNVLFGQPFRSYGLLVIVDCGKGYDFVLAGLDRLDVSVGQRLQAGEPVGVMGGWNPSQPAARPKLYLELRQDGNPVNPTPWLRAQG